MESLAAKEAELTKEVPQLLETMNKTSEEVNLFERKASEAQERHGSSAPARLPYRKLLEQWSRVYEDKSSRDELRSHYGSSIDRVKPYFEAAATFRSASERVQARVRLDRDQQDGLSRATVRVLKCRQEAKQACESWRSQLGDALIKRYEPVFRRVRAITGQLQQHQSTLRTERQRIQGFTERAASAKGIYNKSLAELDRINIAVQLGTDQFDVARCSFSHRHANQTLGISQRGTKLGLWRKKRRRFRRLRSRQCRHPRRRWRNRKSR
eukprot:Skav220288  [mRNA]  locus=scaffold915:120249:123378:+ [translate_table: standard]